MKEIFKKSDDEKKEKKGPTEIVSFLSLVCYIYIFFNFKKNTERLFFSSFVSQIKSMLSI
jgi:hypothetical protein